MIQSDVIVIYKSMIQYDMIDNSHSLPAKQQLTSHLQIHRGRNQTEQGAGHPTGIRCWDFDKIDPVKDD